MQYFFFLLVGTGVVAGSSGSGGRRRYSGGQRSTAPKLSQVSALTSYIAQLKHGMAVSKPRVSGKRQETPQESRDTSKPQVLGLLSSAIFQCLGFQ
jgi:hypothetical protein